MNRLGINAQSIIGKSVSILGAGTQGRRLAYMWSSRGSPVNLIDLQQRQLEDSEAYIHNLKAHCKWKDVQWGKISMRQTSDIQACLEKSWLMVECLPERLQLKKEILLQIDELAPENTIIASNSSSFSISDIIAGLRLRSSSRMLSAHCYWPPEVSAIEIMGHDGTDSEAIDLLIEQCSAHHFTPFHVKRNSTSYIYNRVWAAIKREALMVVAEGVATPEEMDAIFKDVLKTPKGPCEQMDVVGLDVVLDIEEHYAEVRTGLPEEPRVLLRQMLEKGHAGVKSGQGFYKY